MILFEICLTSGLARIHVAQKPLHEIPKFLINRVDARQQHFEAQMLIASSLIVHIIACVYFLMSGRELSGYQFSAFEVGQVVAHLHHGLKAAQISRIIVKKDGVSRFSEQGVQDVIDKLEWARSTVSSGGFTTPTTIQDEHKFNPFMRAAFEVRA